MAVPGKNSLSVFKNGSCSAVLGLVFAIMFALAVTVTAAQAQSFQVIHNFTGLGDGSEPNYGITLDSAGNVYGTTFSGDALTGTVYKLALRGSNWVLSPLYLFTYQGSGGSIPYATVVIGRDGSLYGTTAYGGDLQACPNGSSSGCGTVFNLKPLPSIPPNPITPWNETVLHTFVKTDGANAYGGDLIFDVAGNIYGTTYNGGTGACFGGCGVVYKMTPSGGTWTQTVLYNFQPGTDASHPWAGVIFDQSGNLWGTTVAGGTFGKGTIYQLIPSGGGSWTENIVYNFTGGADGDSPYAGLAFDPSGNVYGATVGGGTDSGGTVYKLTPSGGSWILTTLKSFSGTSGQLARGPFGRMLLDAAGNIYGATFTGQPYGFGSAFKLAPDGSGGYTYTSLHDFTGGLDGGHPRSYLVMDKNGKLYGATAVGGSGNPTNCVGACGVVYQIVP